MQLHNSHLEKAGDAVKPSIQHTAENDYRKHSSSQFNTFSLFEFCRIDPEGMAVEKMPLVVSIQLLPVSFS